MCLISISPYDLAEPMYETDLDESKKNVHLKMPSEYELLKMPSEEYEHLKMPSPLCPSQPLSLTNLAPTTPRNLTELAMEQASP